MIDAFEFKRYLQTKSQKFSHWFELHTKLNCSQKKQRKDFISKIESQFGPMGNSWQYELHDSDKFFLKLDSEKDAVFLLLKLKKN
jgi:hypothetical protein